MIQIYHKAEDSIEEANPCYIRFVTGGSTSDFGDWKTPSNLLDARMEQVGTETILVKKIDSGLEPGTDDLLVFDQNAQIKIGSDGRAVNRNGFSIFNDCTEIFTLITEGDYTGDYQNSSGRIMRLPVTTGFCREVDVATGNLLERYRCDIINDTEIRVWIIEYHNYLIRQFLQFDVSYTEITNTYQNESGKTIQYPIRQGKRKIVLKLETNLNGLEHLKTFFQQPELLLFYQSPTDSAEQYGRFRKTADIQIQTVSRNHSFDNHPFLYQLEAYGTNITYFWSLSEVLAYQQKYSDSCGIYELSVSLEEV